MSNSISYKIPRAEYDLQSSITEKFINRLLTAAIDAGLIPVNYTVAGGFINDQIKMKSTHNVDISIDDVKFFTETNSPTEIGLKSFFSGNIHIELTFDDWNISGNEDSHVDFGYTEIFDIPFSGDFAAIVSIIIVDDESSESRLLIAQLSQLQRFNIFNIGALEPGPDFSEFVRRISDRILIQEIRESFHLPDLDGLLLSMPTPLKALLNARSGRLGSLDLKVIDTTDPCIGDELQLLILNKLNIGLGLYDKVDSIISDNQDIAIVVGYRWLSQIQQDFWLGNIIPRQFSDKGKPNLNGKVFLERFQLVFASDGLLRLRVTLRRKTIGIPLRVNVTIDVKPFIENKSLKIRVTDTDATFEWADNAAKSSLFYGIYELLIRMLLRGFNVLADPVSDVLLTKFLDGQGIEIGMNFRIPKTPYRLEIMPHRFLITRSNVLFTFSANISI